MRIILREEGIKIMEQPKYRFEDLHLQSDKNYTDINDTIKRLIGNAKYNIVMDVVSNNIQDELESVFEEHGAIFEKWIDQLEDDIKCGNVHINIPDEEFKRMIDKHLCDSVGTICYN